MQLLDFTHHLLIDSESARCINYQYIDKFAFRLRQCGSDDCAWRLTAVTREKLYTHLCCKGLQLLNGCRTVDIGTNHHHRFLFIVLQPTREFGRRCGLTRTLQARH